MGLQNGGLDASKLIQNTDVLEKKLDPVVDMLGKISEQLDELDGKKAKASINIETSDSEEKITELKNEFESLLSTLKAPNQKKNYFQSIENSAKDLKRAWNDLANEAKKGTFTEANKYDNKYATTVLRCANAFEALKGNISEISPEMSEFVQGMRQLDKYSDIKGYNFTVKGFEDAFEVFAKMKEAGASLDGFDFSKRFVNVKDDVLELSSLISIWGENSSYASSQASEGYEEQAKAAEKAVEQIKALTQAEMERKLKSEHQKGEVYDWEIDFDDELEDIYKYSKALDELKEKQKEALSEATRYQNDFAIFGDKYGDEDYMQDFIKEYHKYTDQIELVQKRLQEAIRDYTPNASGETGQELNALIIILRDLHEEIVKISSAFVDVNKAISDIGNNKENFSLLLSTIERVNDSISVLGTNLKNLNFSMNMNIDVGSDKELEAKTQSKISNALQAYQRLFEQIKMSGSGGEIVNTKFFDFDINQFDGMMGKLRAYEKFIKTIREEVKQAYNGTDVLYNSIDKKYWTSASAAMGQVTRAFNELRASTDTNPLTEMFGKTDFTEVISQLKLVVTELREISQLVEKGFTVNDILNGKTTDTGEEVKGLEAVKQSVESITEAVNKKTEAFKNEEATIAKIVPNETNYLGKLISALKIINQELDQIAKFSGLDLGNIKIPEVNEVKEVKEGKIAVGATTVSNNPKEAKKRKERTVTKADTGMTAEQIIARTNSLTEATEKLEKDLADQGSVIKQIVEFYDSQDNLVKTVIKEEKELDGILKQTTWTTNYDLKEGTSFSSHIDTDNYDKQNKSKQKMLSDWDEAIHINEELDKANKYSQDYVYSIQQAIEYEKEEKEYLEKRNKLLAEGQRQEKEFYKQQSIELEKQKKQQEDTKYTGSIGDYMKLLKEEISNANIALDFDKVNISSGKSDGSATITFIKDLGKESEVTKLKITDMLEVIDKLQKGTFDISNYKTETNFVTNKESKKTPNTSNNTSKKTVDEITEAYKYLISTEEKYQKLVAKQNIKGSLTPEEASNLKRLTDERTKYNKVLNESVVVLNKEQQALAEKYEAEKNTVKSQTSAFSERVSTGVNYDAAKAYDSLFKSAKRYYELKEKKASGSLTNKNEIDELERLEKEWEDAFQAKNKYAGSDNGNDDSIKRLEETRNRFFNSNQESYLSSVKNFATEMQKAIDKIEVNKKNFQYTDDYYKLIDNLKNKIKELNNYDIDVLSDDDLNKVNKLKTEISGLLQTIKNQTKNLDFQKADVEDVRNQMTKIQRIINENTRMPSGLQDLFVALNKKYKLLIETGGTQADFEKLNQEAAELIFKLEETGKTGNSIFTLIGKKARGMTASFFAMYFSMYDFVRYAQQGFETIQEYDKALTEMNKVSTESIDTLKEFQKESFGLADSVGTTASQIQNSTADFLRLGEAFNEAQKSAQDANALFKVSEFESINEATDALISMSQAYNELEKSEINDILNYVGNNFSLSTSDLATGLQDAAAVLKTQGNDIYEAVALITAGNAITQDPLKTAGGVRTISLRIAGTEEAKEELESLGESVDDYIVQTESKTQQTIKNLTAVASNAGQGIDVLDANGNLRNTYDILLDISKIYKEIQEEDKKAGTNRANALVEYVAGKNRSNIASSILLNPELLEEVRTSAMANSEGSVAREMEAQLESIESHLASLKNAWDKLWINDNNREVITFFLDLAKSILDAVDSFGLLNTLLVGGGGIFGAIQASKGEGRAKMSALIKYAFEEFSGDVCELCVA